MRKTPIILATAALLVGVACGFGSPDRDSSDAGPQQIGTATPAAATSTPPAGPVTAFADGTYQIGTEPGFVPAGMYKTTVPAGSFNCYWERLKGLSGQLSDIIANANAGPGQPVIVTIAATDKAFTTRGCGTWKQ